MASKFPGERDEKAKLHTRKGHDMTWSCDKHGDPIKFYCKEHKIPVCHPCATKEHCHKPCELDDIEDVILERRRKLDDKQQEIEEMKKQLKTLDSKLEFTVTSASNHFQSVNDELQVAFDDKLKIVKDKEKRSIRSIDEEADKEIQIINEKRERRIKSCQEEAEQQQRPIRESLAKVESETKAISEVVAKRVKYITSNSQHAISTMDNADAKIKRIKQDDKTLVNEALQVLASLDDILNLKDVSDCLDGIQREVQKVKFFDGEVGGEHYGRIDGFIGKWELVKSIQIPSIVNDPLVRGLISDDEICVRDVMNDNMYVTNIRTENTQKVIGGDRSMYITSCAPIDSNVIVCGKGGRGRTGGTSDGGITLYDRQWKVIRDISMPRNNRSDTTSVHIDVDRDGMILAALYNQSNIYVINPADGKIVNTITKQGKKLVGSKIQALSSGDIIMTTVECSEFTVISRSGEAKVVLNSDEWFQPRCHFDKLTDTLYITYVDRKRNSFAVDQVSCDGIIQARRIVEYAESVRNVNLYTNPCLVTHSGNLVACDSDKLFVYKKRFIV
ncbi:uncharacterized protein LOC105438725 [Strongylocentrotus purpuratus]|uniref:B box-type domain-containing protein n=1 Tax=Strongylocentrotus purpuratus TaxID=7668 RepID=A0A7M7HDK6_STRPU|nr:uncharacterized protein LOC105438725 [Strongylocentrotus purpuratus]|eukprot:XP_011665200.1 PREDICTED: uncharacterized protein LOC105438725 [Strongylocentrotus purpuratus]